MKRIFFTILLLASAFCFADVPVWLKQPEKAFPTKEYIRAIGDGTSVKAATDSAISNISLIFNAKTEVLTLAVKELNSALKDDQELFQSKQAYTQISKITSNAEFFCIYFTDPYYDKKSDKYSVLAYINKKDASEIYKSRISALMTSIEEYDAYAKSEKEIFLAAATLRKAHSLANLCEQYIKNETVIIPSDSDKYKNKLQTISSIKNQRDLLKKQMTFSIKMVQKDSVFNPVFSMVASILERDGYSYSLVDSNYQIVIDVACTEESYDAGEFVRPSVDIVIVNTSGAGVYTYSKSFPRIGSKTMEHAYIRAVTKINQDLEENFLPE